MGSKVNLCQSAPWKCYSVSGGALSDCFTQEQEYSYRMSQQVSTPRTHSAHILFLWFSFRTDKSAPPPTSSPLLRRRPSDPSSWLPRSVITVWRPGKRYWCPNWPFDVELKTQELILLQQQLHHEDTKRCARVESLMPGEEVWNQDGSWNLNEASFVNTIISS